MPSTSGARTQSTYYILETDRSRYADYIEPRTVHTPDARIPDGRWTDALGSGATVVGVAPRCSSAHELLWSGALLDLRGVDRDQGLRLIAEAARSWRPEQARLNHQRALERLDWRWRFEVLVEVAGLSPRTLSSELALLRRRISLEQSLPVSAAPEPR